MLADGLENSSGKSSSESKSSSSSSSEPRITVLRSRTVDVGAGGDEDKMVGSAGDDGGGGVLEAPVLDVLGCCGLCDEFGAGLKKLVMFPFLVISNLSWHIILSFVVDELSLVSPSFVGLDASLMMGASRALGDTVTYNTSLAVKWVHPFIKAVIAPKSGPGRPNAQNRQPGRYKDDETMHGAHDLILVSARVLDVAFSLLTATEAVDKLPAHIA